MTESNVDFQAVTPRARLVFPSLFNPDTRFAKTADEARYKATLVFEKDEELKELMRVAAGAAKSKWPNGDLAHVTTLQKDMNKIHLPFYNGDEFAEKKGWSWAAGKVVARTSSKFQPQVVGPDYKPVVDQNSIYGGCYVHAQVNFVPFPGNGSNVPATVKMYLNMLMKVGDGDKIGGRDPKQVFAGVKGVETAEDPTDGESRDFDDEIPF